MTTEVHNLVLRKHMLRLRDDGVEGNIDKLLISLNEKGLLIDGWTIEKNPIGGAGMNVSGHPWDRMGEAGDYIYEMYLKVTYTHETKKPDPQQYASILFKINQRAGANNYGRWELATVDGEPYDEPDEIELFVNSRGVVNTKGEDITYADVELPEDFHIHFSHLYGLDNNVGIIETALWAGVRSGWNNRYNCALIGPPGCGKSDICGTIRRMLGDSAVLELDATATTSAGAIKELAERDVLPRIIVLEEIEKAPDSAMDFLLSVLDIRSEIRKVTARGRVERETKLFAVATVNDKDLFLKVKSGALASRFPHKIYFNRPTREQLGMILLREVNKVEGDISWIKPTLDYCETALSADGDIGVTDPRQVIAWCLSGGDLWIPKDGEDEAKYPKMLRATSERVELMENWSR